MTLPRRSRRPFAACPARSDFALELPRATRNAPTSLAQAAARFSAHAWRRGVLGFGTEITKHFMLRSSL